MSLATAEPAVATTGTTPRGVELGASVNVTVPSAGTCGHMPDM